MPGPSLMLQPIPAPSTQLVSISGEERREPIEMLWGSIAPESAKIATSKASKGTIDWTEILVVVREPAGTKTVFPTTSLGVGAAWIGGMPARTMDAVTARSSSGRSLCFLKLVNAIISIFRRTQSYSTYMFSPALGRRKTLQRAKDITRYAFLSVAIRCPPLHMSCRRVRKDTSDSAR